MLSRGFAIVRDERGRVVRSATAAKPGAALDVEVADGVISAQVRAPKPVQGSLF